MAFSKVSGVSLSIVCPVVLSHLTVGAQTHMDMDRECGTSHFRFWEMLWYHIVDTQLTRI